MAHFRAPDTTTGYTINPLTRREDADGKQWIYGHAMASATAKCAQAIFIGADGYRSVALFDTALASTTAAASQRYYIGYPNETIPSDSNGWYQIAGPASGLYINTGTSVSSAAGVFVCWVKASMTADVARSSATLINGINAVGIPLVSGSQTTYDTLLFGNWVVGLT